MVFKRNLILDIKIDIKTVFSKNHKNLFQMSFSKTKNVVNRNIPFKPDGLRFPNTDSKQKLNVSFVKGKNEMNILNHWFEGK